MRDESLACLGGTHEECTSSTCKCSHHAPLFGSCI